MNILISDYHAGCQMWQAATLKRLGVNITINSFSGHSYLIEENTNVTPDAKIRTNVRNIIPVFNEIETTRILKYDTVVVSFPPSFIELYRDINFKFPKILNAGHRLHIHSNNEFIKSLKEKVINNEIILCSMSKYDTEYIKHYMGITPIELYVTCFHIPSSIEYNPTRPEILISPVHATNFLPFNSVYDMNNQAKIHGFNIIFSTVRSLYSHYNYKDLANHRATILFPYSVFSISMVELYEMNIPMFVPSMQLLLKTGIMNDVSIFPLYGSEEDMKRIDIPDTNSPHKYSPNSILPEDKLYWMKYSYFNTKENIIFWNDPLDLFEKISTANLSLISNNMKIENSIHREKQLNNWKLMLECLN